MFEQYLNILVKNHICVGDKGHGSWMSLSVTSGQQPVQCKACSLIGGATVGCVCAILRQIPWIYKERSNISGN